LEARAKSATGGPKVAHENAGKNVKTRPPNSSNELRLALATERQRYENLIAQRQPMTAREAELAETITARAGGDRQFRKSDWSPKTQESKSAEACHRETECGMRRGWRRLSPR